jgi:hypothetical protein
MSFGALFRESHFKTTMGVDTATFYGDNDRTGRLLEGYPSGCSELTRLGRFLFPNLSQGLTDLQFGGFLHVRVQQNEILIFRFSPSESVLVALAEPTDGDG